MESTDLKNKIKISLLFITITLAPFSCKYDFALWPRDVSVEERSTDFTDLSSISISPDMSIIGSDTRFIVPIIGDTHFGRSGWGRFQRYEDVFYEKFEQLITDYKNQGLKIPFCIHVGDCSDSGKQSEFDEYNAFCNKINEIIKDVYSISTDTKMYAVVGNHDLFNNGWDNWKKNTFPNTSTYYFKTNVNSKPISWYFLDSGSGTLGKPQLDKFTQLVKEDSNTKLIISHYPVAAKNCDMYTLQDPIEVAKVLKAYGSSNVKMGIEGHFHPGAENDFYTSDGQFMFHEEVLPGFVDHRGYAILTVDCSSTNPAFNLKVFEY